ncbi:sensor histidine kinase [Stieleria magnilauensis]|uniref:histidine kinase n=1 Tax=Stieleria magnilauensis TaxID=2527963 RepID=A0ABX5XT32_9BACT|nr:Phytochrome-like protein cph1 [Planctomycetes bacterium TBK1r]
MEKNKLLKVLLVEDNETHAHLVRRHLKKARLSTIEATAAETLADAIAAASENEFDAVLLDLSLPDSEITETLPRFIDAVPSVPTIVLTSLDDLDFASSLVHQGADDFLVKSDIDSQILLRSIRYAIERKRSQRELADYAKRLERSNEELKHFAHTIAHEIRSPLSVVSCCLFLIREDYGQSFSDDCCESIDDAEAAIRGMSELVTELLNYSRVENDSAQFADIDLQPVFDDVITALRSEIERSAAEVTAGELPMVHGNEIQLRQVLKNLIGNAIKYCDPTRPPRVHVMCEEQDTEFQITVRDNGLGTPAASRELIFNPFTRVHESTGISGTGIGLSFCQRIIDNHGGSIGVVANQDVGSTFWFKLPKVSGHSADAIQK